MPKSRLRALTRRLADERAGLRIIRKSGIMPPLRSAPKTLTLLARRGVAGVPGVFGALHGDRTALVDERGPVTYEGIGHMCDGFMRGARLAEESGSVAMMCRNSRYSLVVLLSAIASGRNLVLLNADMGARQVAEAVTRENVTTVVFDEEFSPAIAEVAPTVAKTVAWYDGARPDNSIDALIVSAPVEPIRFNARPGMPTLLTSGTSGTPRGITHDGSRAPGSSSPGLALLGGFIAKIQMRRDDRAYVAAPLYHGWGLIIAMSVLMAGGTLVTRRRFDAGAVVDLCDFDAVNCLIMVPTMLNRLLALDAADLDRIDPNQIRMVGTGGAKVSVDTVKSIADRWGPVLHNLYGCSEAGFITIATPNELAAHPDTAGSAPLGVRVEILDENGVEVPRGTVGRIFVDNGMQVSGYTDGSRKRIVRGMMDTGDTGRIDDGLLFIEGRSDGMIVSGGENVFPEEVEAALAQHDDVLDVAVIAVDDDEFGSRLRAYVVLSDDADWSYALTKEFITEQLSRSRVPREIMRVSAIPRGETGKAMRKRLLETEAIEVYDAATAVSA